MFHKTLAITIALVLLMVGLVPAVSAASAAQVYPLYTTASLSADQAGQPAAVGANTGYGNPSIGDLPIKQPQPKGATMKHPGCRWHKVSPAGSCH